MSFPGFPSSLSLFPFRAAFPSPFRQGAPRPRRRPVARSEPVPAEERTHALLDRFRVLCGLSRIGTDLEYVRGEGDPTCPNCAREIAARARRKNSAAWVLEHLPAAPSTTEW